MKNNNIQLVLFASLAKDDDDILPGHIWVDRGFLEIQNMKYLCASTLSSILKEQAQVLDDYKKASAKDTNDVAAATAMRQECDALKEKIEALKKSQMKIGEAMYKNTDTSSEGSSETPPGDETKPDDKEGEKK